MHMYVYVIHLSVYIFILNDIYTTCKVDSCVELPKLGDLGSGLTLESSQSSLEFHLWHVYLHDIYLALTWHYLEIYVGITVTSFAVKLRFFNFGIQMHNAYSAHLQHGDPWVYIMYSQVPSQQLDMPHMPTIFQRSLNEFMSTTCICHDHFCCGGESTLGTIMFRQKHGKFRQNKNMRNKKWWLN